MNARTFPQRSLHFFMAATTGFLLLTGCKKDDSGPAVNNNLFSKVTLATNGGVFVNPSSAIPDASDQFIYFIATDSTTNAKGVFKVTASGGAAVPVFTGAPFSNPVDIALSTDNQTLFVADANAGSSGGIYSLSINGSTPTLVMGTGGTSAVALDVIQRSGQDQIYFCGTNAGDGQKAVFEIPSTGASAPVIRHKGAPLTTPSGIVSAKNGDLFISDGSGIVHKLSGTTMTQLAGGIIMGIPAGIALSPDEGAVMVSSKNSGSGTAQVTVISLQDGSVVLFNKVIGANSNPGGLHAARNSAGATGDYGWADVQRPGRVYRVEP